MKKQTVLLILSFLLLSNLLSANQQPNSLFGDLLNWSKTTHKEEIFLEEFVSETELPADWKVCVGLLTDNSSLSDDWTKWILQNFANDGTDNIGMETTFFNTNGAWLLTPTFSLNSDSNYTFEFDLALTAFQDTEPGSMEDDDKFMVIISTDNGATWSNAQENLLRIWTKDSTISTNEHIVLDLTGFSGDVKIGFYAESTVLSNDSEIFVDNVALYKVVEMQETNTPQNFAAVLDKNNVTVSWEAPTLAVDGYNLYRNNVKLNSAPITELTYSDLNLGNRTYKYFATAIIGGIESEKSDSVTLTVEYQEMSVPRNLSARIFDANNLKLTWDIPISGVPKVGIAEDFEVYNDFSLNFLPWTTNDVDNVPCYSILNSDFPNEGVRMAYMIFNPSATEPALNLEAHSGDKFAAAIAATTKPNNDWLISPCLSLRAGEELSFWARSITDEYGLEKFNVAISTTDTALANFTVISGTTPVEAPTEWTNYTYSLADYAEKNVYIAIQCVSSSAFMLMVDDFEVSNSGEKRIVFNENITYASNNLKKISGLEQNVCNKKISQNKQLSTDRNLVSYKIYCNDEFLTEITDLAKTEYEIENLADTTYKYHVTACYEGGESEASNVVTVVIDAASMLPPDNLTAEIIESNDVELNWEMPGGLSFQTMEPTDDVYSDPNGTQAQEHLWVANFSPAGHHERAMLKFDLSAITENSVEFAYLNLYQFFKAPDNSPTTIQIYAITENWDENSYNTQEHIAHGDSMYASFNLGKNGWQTIDITGLVNDWLSNSIENHGLVIIAREGDKFRKFFSKDATGSNADKHPSLYYSVEDKKSVKGYVPKGYSVYKNGEFIASINSVVKTKYIDYCEVGTYEYSVRTVYDMGESTASNTAEIEILPPVIKVDITSIEKVLELGQHSNARIEIGNTGDSKLKWKMKVMPSIQSKSAGDLITSFDMPNDMLVYAAGYDGDGIWVSDVMVENNDKLYKISFEGEILEELEIPWTGSWTSEIVPTADFLYTLVVNPYGPDVINKVDKTTGELVSTISGEFGEDGANVSHALAYNRADDEFWIGGWFHEYIYHIDSEGNVISKFSTSDKPYHDLTGLAWHPAGGNDGSLFAVARNPYMIYELNPTDGAIIQSFPTPDEANLNGLSIDKDGNLWSASMTESMLYNIESGVELSAQVSWLLLTNVSGEVAPANTGENKVIFNTTGLTEGIYHADLVIESNDSANSEITIPVTMTLQDSVAILELDNEDITLYPNPFKNDFQITSSDKEIRSIYIYDETGRLCYVTNSVNNKSENVSLEKFNSGIYFVRIKTENGNIIKKVIKK